MAGVGGAVMSAVCSAAEEGQAASALLSTLARFLCAGVVIAATMFASTILGLPLSQLVKELQDSGLG